MIYLPWGILISDWVCLIWSGFKIDSYTAHYLRSVDKQPYLAKKKRLCCATSKDPKLFVLFFEERYAK